MPKKTKKEKLRADGRHKTLPSLFSLETSLQPQISTPTFTFQSSHTPKSRALTMDTDELHAIRIDLIKTISLALLAIAAELTIYWKYFS